MLQRFVFRCCFCLYVLHTIFPPCSGTVCDDEEDRIDTRFFVFRIFFLVICEIFFLAPRDFAFIRHRDFQGGELRAGRGWSESGQNNDLIAKAVHREHVFDIIYYSSAVIKYNRKLLFMYSRDTRIIKMKLIF